MLIQFHGDVVELVNDRHLGVENLCEAVSDEVCILVGSVTFVKVVLDGVKDNVVHGETFVCGESLETSF